MISEIEMNRFDMSIYWFRGTQIIPSVGLF